MTVQIEVPCVPLCELVFRDPRDFTNDEKVVVKHVDFDQLVRLFEAVDHTYPMVPGETAEAADFDAIGARVAAYQEIIQGMTPYGPQSGQEVPPQTEGTLRSLRNLLYEQWLKRQAEQKKTAPSPPQPPNGKEKSSSGVSPSVPSWDAT